MNKKNKEEYNLYLLDLEIDCLIAMIMLMNKAEKKIEKKEKIYYV
jgi:hypothetical protein